MLVALKNASLEILVIFILGGLFYLYQRQKYLRYHETITTDFMNKIREADQSFTLPNDFKKFELTFIANYKQEKNFDSYSQELQLIFEDYLNYIESISGPVL